MTDLHITNGDGAATIIKVSAVDGDVLPWRDTMHHGPFPAGLDLDKLSEVRAAYFAGQGVDESETRRDFRLRDEQLRTAPTYDRVVLWFEHDLLDQLQIVQLLDWFLDIDLGKARLEIICIDQFDGIDPFRGLGQLDALQMASLYDQRQPVTEAKMALARRGWTAFRSPDPNDLHAFLESDLSPLPFLHAALTRHLEEYPSCQTGLTRTERQILELVAAGVSAPGMIFQKNMDLETALFIGDWRTFEHIGDLAAGDVPLLTCEADGTFRYPPQSRLSQEAFQGQRLRLTDVGKQVLDGRCDAFDLIERDTWLGGVHLRSDRPMWTWDTHSESVRLRKP